MDAMYKYFTFLLLLGSGVGAQLLLEPLNAVALRGSNVSFNATVTGGWTIMTWSVADLLVLTINEGTGPVAFSSRYVGRNVSKGSVSAWEFSILDVQVADIGSVVCTVQGMAGAQTAQLKVEVQGTLAIVSGNQTVTQDEEVEFRCDLADWFPRPTVTWWLDGGAVSPSLYNTTFQPEGTLFNATSVLRVRAVRDATVQCRALLLAASATDSVFLSVVPKPTDWTILIAVVVSFASFALLVLLILGIIFCYKRKKEKENELRQRRVQEQADTVRTRHGTINVGFAMDDRTNTDRGGVTPSADRQRESPRIYQIPPVDNQNRPNGNGHPAVVSAPEPRKHRHLTIV